MVQRSGTYNLFIQAPQIIVVGDDSSNIRLVKEKMIFSLYISIAITIFALTFATETIWRMFHTDPVESLPFLPGSVILMGYLLLIYGSWSNNDQLLYLGIALVIFYERYFDGQRAVLKA
jgi:hypothetical protein